ncbi:hypothetical protein G3601_002964 [Salmonella enterica]|uniref:Uncharacterized protein n=3 Tax=Salmonella enterica TaxID=28901 RepID=A0A9Y2Y8U2_SALEB|nr:hypothetical protein [Salmonella enterica subsp. enterica serovar Java]EAN9727932.1 hypothetical protein [Salmonella enterica]EBV8390470.1 hypothetical protein [Salmonella enterica subsp. enterica serovar Virchow]EDQ0182206.1 hypothetical protein [Salmonella enterica subsp. enterica serovar 4,[5],12:b:-]EDV9615213.1 hypothetical protein [Salmonella enterica subsp. enterica serovar Paratyphi B]EEE5612111.1 hypothetical protein [Salmonella enterica subsp. enterica serovar Typhimurium]
MSITISVEETEELVEEQSLIESVIESDEYSLNLQTNVDFCENVCTMPLSKELYDKTIASLTMFLTKVRRAIVQFRVKALTIVRAKCLTRRSARTHRSKSAAKSTASNSKNTDGGDPEPAPPPVVFLRVKVKSVFSFDTAFANRLAQGDA